VSLNLAHPVDALIGSTRLPMGNDRWRIEWSRDRWRHVTPKGQVVTTICLERNISKTTWQTTSRDPKGAGRQYGGLS